MAHTISGITESDGEPKPEPEFLYLATVNILVRAKSPDHAAGAITHIISDYDMDDGTLLGWDYATLGGVEYSRAPGPAEHLYKRIE